MSAMTTDPAAATLRATGTPGLLRAAYALTHRIGDEHAGLQREDIMRDLYSQRALIDTEIFRRCGEGS